MSCTSCHNPHESPSADERASYFRGKCLACHGNAFAAAHHPDKSDCTACHMPSSLSSDISHTEVTDHRIQRRPQVSPHLLQDPSTQQVPLRLAPFPDSRQAEDDIRDLALAWQSVAENGSLQARHEAERLLPLAVKQSPDDPILLSTFAYTELNRGAIDHAQELYKRALALDPLLIDAATNLGVIEAQSGHLGEAVKLWQGAFERAPGKSGIGINLARAFCKSGQIKEAREYVERIVRFNPDLDEGKKMLQNLNDAPPKCSP